MDWIIGIDGGGSRTTAAIGNMKGETVGFTDGEGLNYQVTGIKVFIKRINEILCKASEDYNLNLNNLVMASMGIAGLNTSKDRRILEDALLQSLIKDKHFIYNDSWASLVAGAGKLEGIVLIAGTGSIAFGINNKGQEYRAGGWGHIISDCGSGYWLAVKALEEGAKVMDKEGELPNILKDIINYKGYKTFDDIMAFLYGEETQKGDIADLTKRVSELASQGDPIAHKVLEQGAKELSTMVERVFERGFKGTENVKIVLAGSVLKKVDVLRNQVTKNLSNIGECVLLEVEPSIGALALGYNKLGLDYKLIR